jgi:hypothetical protein
MSVMMFVDGILLLPSPGMLAVEKREKSRRTDLVFVGLNGRENLGLISEPDSLQEFLGEPDGHQADEGTPRDRDNAES